ncbi:MAG: 23S rRNA (adenine1618-N6)-methyltransferase [Arenicella sp.]|jgi:23S rRNA (adenine1618-N6)-methyltransferase
MKREAQFHRRSKHHGRYDFKALCEANERLKPFVIRNEHGDDSVNFTDAEAVKQLNAALLCHFYGLKFWDIPEGYLCPPIPGRAEYIHQIADLIADDVSHKNKVTCLDIGVGANCIYPIIAASQYKWDCIGTDIDADALKNAEEIVYANDVLKKKVEIRLQTNIDNIFAGVIKKNERIDVTICNPPFYKSHEDALAATSRKNKNLHKGRVDDKSKNFGGMDGELFCEGGESKFISKMIKESEKYAKNCEWFTCLVSQESHLKKFHKVFKSVNTREYKVIPMTFGNKKSRILAWRFPKQN